MLGARYGAATLAGFGDLFVVGGDASLGKVELEAVHAVGWQRGGDTAAAMARSRQTAAGIDVEDTSNPLSASAFAPQPMPAEMRWTVTP